ncbi:MAG: OmpA family protein [Pseudomonadota bacterium]
MISALLRGAFATGIAGAAWAASTIGTDPIAGAPEAPERAILLISIDSEAATTLTGRLPAGIARSDLRAAFPGAEMDGEDGGVSTIEGDEGAEAELWRTALAALPVVLPRISQATIEICDGRIRIDGKLKPGFSLRAAQPALRTALATDWALDLALEEAPPPAMIEFQIAGGTLQATGMLPNGLSVRQGTATLTEATGPLDPEALQLATGGTGNTADWTVALGALGRLTRLYADAEGGIGNGGLAIGGTLRPGQNLAEIERWLTASLPAPWDLSLAGTETPARRGTLRIAPDTGRPERLRGTRWVPAVPTETDREVCDRAMEATQRSGRLTFLSGMSVLEDSTARLLDRLAGIAHACLAGGGGKRTLRIGGHTDSDGDDARNLALSEARAQAVLDALLERGLPQRALYAVGYGESRPIAPNETEDGRQRNRRITFDWSDH